MLKLLFKMNLDPLGSYNVYICIQYGAYVTGDILGNPGSKKYLKEHLLTSVRSYTRK